MEKPQFPAIKRPTPNVAVTKTGINSEDAFQEARLNAIGDKTLTICQERTLREIWEFYFDDAILTWNLRGSAGVGKSFVTKVLKDLLPYRNLAITAPTHKAKNVTEKFSGIPGETVHRLLGLRPNLDIEDLDINNPQFDPQVEPSIGMYDLVFVDECSMVGDSLYELLVSEAARSRTKILFIGDPNQLPPVRKAELKQSDKSHKVVEGESDNLEISRAFTECGGTSILMTPARQSIENPLYGLLVALRSDIDGSDEAFEGMIQVLKSLKIDIDKIVKHRGKCFGAMIRNVPEMFNGNEGFLITQDRSVFTRRLLTDFVSKDFEEDSNFCRLMSFKNAVVKQWNILIRKARMKSVEDILVEGDLVMAYKTVYNELQQAMITNSEEYRISSIEEEIMPITIIRGGFPVDKDFNVKHVTLEPLDGVDYATAYVVMPPYDNFCDAHSYYHQEGIMRRAWRQYYAFKNRFLVLDDLTAIYGKRYGTLPNKDLDYAYGITVHKSQGSTYRRAYVNLNDILSYKPIATQSIVNKFRREPTAKELTEINRFILKLVYVALSRASEQGIGLL